MNARFAWIRTLSGAGLIAAAALFVGGIAGCDVRETRSGGAPTTAASSADLSKLPEEFVQTISSPKPTVVDFYATWCPPCQEQKPLFAEAERQYGEAATFVTVDVDENPEIAEAYEIGGIPTLMIFKEGQPVAQMVGLHSTEEIGEALTPFID